MATSGRTLSPGGALLRSSRMFSLPSAIPPPPGDHQAASKFHSPTATQTFPTLQTVTAPEQFRQRGDWGFKRYFPLRSTVKTSTPCLRIKHVDSMEQVTDYETASSHSLTLEKMREMNIAISLPHATSGYNQRVDDPSPLQSVFEDEFDFTALDVEKITAAGHRRWKYKGPWLANFTHGEFQRFLKKQVRNRREEFRDLMRKHIAEKQNKTAAQEAERQAMEAGTEVSGQAELPQVRPEDVTDAQIAEFTRAARNGPEELYNLVSNFLDLPPIDHEGTDHIGSLQSGQTKTLDEPDPYAKYGPPVTHPSAGLSYLRTDAFLENHPVYGPQKLHAPVQARVMGGTGKQMPRVAVGGFVANGMRELNLAVQAEYLSPGGPKVWAHVTSAQVNSKGRAILQVKTAHDTEKFVQQEMQGMVRVFRDGDKSRKDDASNSMDQPLSKTLKPSIRNKGKPTIRMSGAGTYGA